MASTPQTQSSQPRPAGPQARVTLSYEEISKLFSLPIAEAASILGVCTSVLKRICRTHGIVRWPYRKLVSGKAVDDIRRDAEREKIELLKMGKQKPESSKMMPVGSPGSSAALSPSLPQGAAKSQQGFSKPGQVSSQGNKHAGSGSPNLVQTAHTKNIPTYMDDFKYGFPSNGLSSASVKWWGTSSHAESATVKDESREPLESTNETPRGMTDDELDWDAEDSAIENEPSARLCSLRRKAVEDGRELLKGEASKGQEIYTLSKRQKLVLLQVFRTSLPDQWKDKLS